MFIQRLIAYVGSHRTISLQEARNWGKFSRVRLPINIKQPLRDSITFPLSNGQEITAELRYECLPRFCLFCGLLGHLMRICPKVHQLKDKVHQDFPTELDQQAYDLIVPKYHRSIDASLRKYGNDFEEFKEGEYQEEDIFTLEQNRRSTTTKMTEMMSRQSNSAMTMNFASTSSSYPSNDCEDNLHRQLPVSGMFSDNIDLTVKYPFNNQPMVTNQETNISSSITTQNMKLSSSVTIQTAPLHQMIPSLPKGKAIALNQVETSSNFQFNSFKSLQVSESLKFVSKKLKSSTTVVSDKSINENLHQLLSGTNNRSQNSNDGRILWNS